MKCNCSAVMDHFEDAYDGRENKMGEYYWCPACGTLLFKATNPRYKDWTKKPKGVDKWISVNDRLPDAPMRVWACWDLSTGDVVEMDFVTQRIREKEGRFLLNDRNSPWDVLFWHPFYKPKPPKFET